jgi:outer membrane usher protein FimD/PapC
LDGSISASTSIAYAEGRLAAANAFGDALGILVPSGELSGERVELRPVDGAPVKSLDGRPTLIAGLRPYKPFVAAVEMPDSPPERRPDSASIEFTPPYKSITVIEIGVAATNSIRARLVDEAGPVPGLSGQLLDAKGTATGSGTFSDEAGIFECYGVAAGHIQIQWSDGRTSLLEVSSSKLEGISDLGDILALAP